MRNAFVIHTEYKPSRLSENSGDTSVKHIRLVNIIIYFTFYDKYATSPPQSLHTNEFFSAQDGHICLRHLVHTQ